MRFVGVRRWFDRSSDPIPVSPALGDTVIAAAGVTARRGSTNVLTEVDLDVIAGEVLVLVGPNGAGKSTLLAVLAGDLDTVSGSVTIGGRPAAESSTIDIARQRAVLPQQHVVGFAFTTEQIVRMGRSPWVGTAAAVQDDELVNEAMRTCDVTEFADRPFASLSGGERARVALARVLAQDTATILLDEPTAALDLGHQETVMSVARARAAAGCAVVVVLHDLGLAAAYADRVTVLDSGRVVATGSPRDVFSSELLTRVYRHPVDVFDHPDSGALLVLPSRS